MKWVAFSLMVAVMAGGCSGPAGVVGPFEGTGGQGLDQPAGGAGGQDPGTPVGIVVPPGADLATLRAALEQAKGLDGQTFAQAFRPSYPEALGYDPSSAAGLDRIQASTLALNEAESAGLAQRGFVISERENFPSFIHGYVSLYGQHLPLFVTADSVLHALYRSYDLMLQELELQSLVPALTDLLGSARAALGAGAASGYSDAVRADVDLYLTLATSLLGGQQVAPTGFADPAVVTELYGLAVAGQAASTVELFGIERAVDWSQFVPRGHYAGKVELEQYFRAMIWLGRTDLRLIETEGNGTQVFRRRQLETAYALRDLLDQQRVSEWQMIDRTLGDFVGEADNMTLPELDQLLSDLGLSSSQELAGLDDNTLAQAIVDGGYGLQRIQSQLAAGGPENTTLPLSSVFLLFGQRYTPDSHVFSNVVYDRVPERAGIPLRLMPNPLDVGFAALANNQAAQLLGSEITQYAYAPQLAEMRVLIDSYPTDYWSSSLYTLWLDALRSLSPGSELEHPKDAGLPSVTGTAAWQRRLLNGQLGSWAELRHNTVLYVKESYTGVPACEYPDAYVEPNPTFFARVVAFADRGKELVGELSALSSAAPLVDIGAYFERLASLVGTLQGMAEYERAGTPFTAEQMEFINHAVTWEVGCVTQGVNGWYADLYYAGSGMDRDDLASSEYRPPIVDVHTQPADEAGTAVGRVLHVGTGKPRLMVVTVDTCTGPRAYAGLVTAYFEKITENWQRLTDQAWATELEAATPADVPWMADLVVR